MTRKEEQLILQRVRKLSSERLKEVLDFIEFLEHREQKHRWVTFDEWAMNLAKDRGFNHLMEEDVAEIVKAHRQQDHS